MNKKFAVLLVLFFIALFTIPAILASNVPGLPSYIPTDTNPGDLITSSQSGVLGYLTSLWTSIKSNFLVTILISVLKKFSFIIPLAFGVPYSYTISFLITVVLWLYFGFLMYTFLSAFTSKAKRGLDIAGGVLFAILLVWIKILPTLSKFVFNLYNTQDSSLKKALIILAVIVAMAVGYIIVKWLRGKLKDWLEKKAEEAETEEKVKKVLKKEKGKRKKSEEEEEGAVFEKEFKKELGRKDSDLETGDYSDIEDLKFKTAA